MGHPVMMGLIRASLALAMLAYASLRDILEREVPDATWLIFGALGLLMDIYEVYRGSATLLGLGVTVLASTAVSYLMGYLGLFGGADFKALAVLSLLQPYPPGAVEPLLGAVSQIYPLTVLSNSALLGASMAPFQLIRNLYSAFKGSRLFEEHRREPIWRKLMVLISGSKMSMSSVRGPPFHYPLEAQGVDGRRLLSPLKMRDEEAVRVLEEFRRAGVSEIWISKTLPFILFITLGFLASVFIGDIALWLIIRVIT